MDSLDGSNNNLDIAIVLTIGLPGHGRLRNLLHPGRHLQTRVILFIWRNHSLAMRERL